MQTYSPFLYFLMQKTSLDSSVPLLILTPQLFVPNPINVNPNSIANVQKVLKHIEEISGIKHGDCNWVVVVWWSFLSSCTKGEKRFSLAYISTRCSS